MTVTLTNTAATTAALTSTLTVTSKTATTIMTTARTASGPRAAAKETKSPVWHSSQNVLLIFSIFLSQLSLFHFHF